MDKSEMIGEIARRMNIRLDLDDPAFILVELNRLMLESAGKDLEQSLQGIGAASVAAANKIEIQTHELASEAERITQLIHSLESTERARGIEHTITGLKEAILDAEKVLNGIKKEVYNSSIQSRDVAVSVRDSVFDLKSAKCFLEDAVSKGINDLENIDGSAVAAHQKTVLGLAALALLSVSLMAGMVIGKKIGSANTPENRFMEMNDVRAMVQCKNGVPQLMTDGTKTCAMKGGAWRIE